MTGRTEGARSGMPDRGEAGPILPPRLLNPDGRPRRVGVEIEFAALSASAAAMQVQDLFGGRIEEEDPHRFHVRRTRLGDFTCELDTKVAHGPADETEENGDDPLDDLLWDFRASLRSLYGDVSSLVMPCEIVCPPLPIADLHGLETLLAALREAGAAGTRASPLYGFGTHLNAEISDGGHDWIVAMLKAYLLMSDWLRAVMRIDTTRRLLAFTDPFPERYAAKVIDPGYWPDRARLIDDYLADNPTRNRELDMLPLFAWLDPDRVRARVDDRRVKPRPTFHYRLPDANFDRPDWGVMLEWRRWCVIERLAERPELIARMGHVWRANRDRLFPLDWAIQASEWVMTR